MTCISDWLHFRDKGIGNGMRIPRGRSDDLDGFVLGEGLVPGGSFSGWDTSDLIKEGGNEAKSTMVSDGEDALFDEADSDDLDFGFSGMVDRKFAKRRRFEGGQLVSRKLILLGICTALLVGGIIAWLSLTAASRAVEEAGDSASVAEADAPAVENGLSREVEAHVRLSQGQIDALIAAYSFNGVEHEVVARDVASSTHGLSFVESDGTRAAPTAEATLSYILEDVLVGEAASRGISVRESEIETKATALYGTSRYDEIAAPYGVSGDDVRASVERVCVVEKLRGKVAPKSVSVEAPVAPSTENASEPSALYGAYLVVLLGNEWDASTGTWARTDGPFYQALKDETFDAEHATYSQASLAYSIASRQSNLWDAYLGEIRSRLHVVLYGAF